jgi:hypothetical protein
MVMIDRLLLFVPSISKPHTRLTRYITDKQEASSLLRLKKRVIDRSIDRHRYCCYLFHQLILNYYNF